jgi:hypothetical protein
MVWDVSPGKEPRHLETLEGIIPSIDTEYVLGMTLFLIAKLLS